MRLRFHTQTAGVSLTAQQPMNNVVRTAIEALAAVLGGTQSLHTNALDEVLALPTEDTAKLALRTQQVIAFESGVADVIDPLGGSWFVEEATDRIEALAEEIFAEIERMGDGSMLEGVLEGIEQGWFQRRIAESAFQEQRRYESGDLVKVGVTRFVDANETPIDTLVIGEDDRAGPGREHPSHASRSGRGRGGRRPDRAQGGRDHRRQPDGTADRLRQRALHRGGDRGGARGRLRDLPGDAGVLSAPAPRVASCNLLQEQSSLSA